MKTKIKNLEIRLLFYAAGLFVMTAGISLSVKSRLGVSPVSSIPYTLTCIWGIEMGRATIFFHCALVLLQIVLLRKNFKPKNLLQIAVGIVFGYFTTFCNSLAALLPECNFFALRILLTVLSAFLVAFGIFLYVPADIMFLAGEGIIKAVSDIFCMKFSRVKIGFDVTMVSVSLATCIFFLKKPGSVGLGTIISSVLVGFFLGLITDRFGGIRNRILFGERLEKNQQ